MKVLFKLVSSFLLFFVLILDSFAIDAPMNLKIDSVEDTTVNLSWDSVETAYMYYVSYGKTSGTEGTYEFQTDFTESTGSIISSLEYDNTYYFVVTALDENGDESVFSNEVSTDIYLESTTSDVNNFSLVSAKALSAAEVELTFSEELDTTEGTEREFKLYNKSDSLDSYDFLSIDLNMEDSTKLSLTLDRELESGVEYELVVIAIKNASGQNIESGIDSVESFIFNEEVIAPEAETITEETTMSGTVTDEELLDLELNSADTETTEDSTAIDGELTTVTTDGETTEDSTTVDGETINVELNAATAEGPTGVDVEMSDIENTTLGAAETSTQLPKTGPEHIFMLILAVILGTLIFVFKYKKA